MGGALLIFEPGRALGECFCLLGQCGAFEDARLLEDGQPCFFEIFADGSAAANGWIVVGDPVAAGAQIAAGDPVASDTLIAADVRSGFDFDFDCEKILLVAVLHFCSCFCVR